MPIILKAWKKYNNFYIQIGTGKKGESSNYQFLNENLYKTWKAIDNPSAIFNYKEAGLSLEQIKKAIEEVSSNA